METPSQGLPSNGRLNGGLVAGGKKGTLYQLPAGLSKLELVVSDQAGQTGRSAVWIDCGLQNNPFCSVLDSQPSEIR
jgi:hypothetical protein